MAGRTILMTTDAVGGVWQYTGDLARELASLGHRVVIAAMGPAPTDAQRRALADEKNIKLVETRLPLDWLCDNPAPVIAASASLAQLASDEDADLIHCNMPSLAGAADWPVPVVAVAHGCVSTWWVAAREDPLAPQYAWHREMTRQGLESADCVVAPSATYAATIARHYGLSRQPRVVLNGRRPPAREERTGSGIQAALTVGRLWDSVKNAGLLDRVAAELEVPFFAAGALRGPHGEEVTLAHLQTLGEIAADELAALMAKRPVFVSAASFEPFGLAVLEAADAGCALVLSDIPTFRELWDGAALFATPGDALAFEGAIHALLTNHELRERIAAAAALRALRYTPAATAKVMSAIYDEIMQKAEIRV
jgi:glycosyltransferase involved in cell wall biosynthesis